MACSSHAKGGILIDLFNLPIIPDERRKNMIFCKIPNNFSLPHGKNSRLSQIIKTWTFGRLTLDGNEGVGVKIAYLEHAYGTKYYVVDQVNGNINVIHDDNLEFIEFMGCFCPFDLEDLELKVCKSRTTVMVRITPGWMRTEGKLHKVHQAHNNHLSQKNCIHSVN